MRPTESYRNRLIAFRTTAAFTNNLDKLCDDVSASRSQLVRFALHKLLETTKSNPHVTEAIKREMY